MFLVRATHQCTFNSTYRRRCCRAPRPAGSSGQSPRSNLPCLAGLRRRVDLPGGCGIGGSIVHFGVVVVPLRKVLPEAGCAEVFAVPGFTSGDGYPPDECCGGASPPALSERGAPPPAVSTGDAPSLPAPRAEPTRSRSTQRCSPPARRSSRGWAHPRVRRQRSRGRHPQSARQGQSLASDRVAEYGAGRSFVRETQGSALAAAVALIAQVVGQGISSRDLLPDVETTRPHLPQPPRDRARAERDRHRRHAVTPAVLPRVSRRHATYP